MPLSLYNNTITLYQKNDPKSQSYSSKNCENNYSYFADTDTDTDTDTAVFIS